VFIGSNLAGFVAALELGEDLLVGGLSSRCFLGFTCSVSVLYADCRPSVGSDSHTFGLSFQ